MRGSSSSRPSIVVDSREQEPYVFSQERVAMVRHALLAGDYTIAGLENRVAVERKSLDDFASTVIRSRRRFYAELRRLQGLDAACVVVEGGLGDLLTGRYRGAAHPRSVFGAAMAIIVDFGVPVFFCGNRQIARLFVEEYLLRANRRFADQ